MGEVNCVARLSAAADAGKALISEATAEAAGESFPEGSARELDLKGIDGPLKAFELA